MNTRAFCLLTLLLSIVHVSKAAEILIATSTANEINADVGYSRTIGEYLVAYATYNDGQRGIGIYAQRVLADGTLPDLPHLVFFSQDHSGLIWPEVSIVYNEYLGRYLIAWNSLISIKMFTAFTQRK